MWQRHADFVEHPLATVHDFRFEIHGNGGRLVPCSGSDLARMCLNISTIHMKDITIGARIHRPWMQIRLPTARAFVPIVLEPTSERSTLPALVLITTKQDGSKTRQNLSQPGKTVTHSVCLAMRLHRSSLKFSSATHDTTCN